MTTRSMPDFITYAHLNFFSISKPDYYRINFIDGFFFQGNT